MGFPLSGCQGSVSRRSADACPGRRRRLRCRRHLDREGSPGILGHTVAIGAMGGLSRGADASVDVGRGHGCR